MRQVFHGMMPKVGKLQCTPFVEALEKLRGKHVLLTVGEAKETRTNQQNRYYWGCVVKCIAMGMKDMGYDPHECTSEAVHDLLKYRFLRIDKPIGGDGEFITLVRSTTDLGTAEFVEFVEHCIRFGAQYLNVVIDPPGTQMELTQAA